MYSQRLSRHAKCRTSLVSGQLELGVWRAAKCVVSPRPEHKNSSAKCLSHKGILADRSQFCSSQTYDNDLYLHSDIITWRSLSQTIDAIPHRTEFGRSTCPRCHCFRTLKLAWQRRGRCARLCQAKRGVSKFSPGRK